MSDRQSSLPVTLLFRRWGKGFTRDGWQARLGQSVSSWFKTETLPQRTRCSVIWKDTKFNFGPPHAREHICISQKYTINMGTYTYMTCRQLYTSKNPQVYDCASIFSTNKKQEMRNLLFELILYEYYFRKDSHTCKIFLNLKFLDFSNSSFLLHIFTFRKLTIKYTFKTKDRNTFFFQKLLIKTQLFIFF